MSTKKIQKGDTVRVIAGHNKGLEGKVIQAKDGKVVVEGVNMVSKHSKRSAQNQNGGIIHQEAAIDVSNVMYVHKGEVARIQFKVEEENGKRKVTRLAKVAGKDAEAI
ncbi:MAG: 50S ribosomal protein L24 [Lachnospiraceae bacterium]|nr:50S ribosomal protein L24 [Lachnospiraceae bacterium]